MSSGDWGKGGAQISHPRDLLPTLPSSMVLPLPSPMASCGRRAKISFPSAGDRDSVVIRVPPPHVLNSDGGWFPPPEPIIEIKEMRLSFV